MFDFYEYEYTVKSLEYLSIFLFPSCCSAVFHCQPCQEDSFKINETGFHARGNEGYTRYKTDW